MIEFNDRIYRILGDTNVKIQQNIKDRDATKIQRLWILLLRKLLSAYSVCATVARRTLRQPIKFVDIVWWAVLHRNLGIVFATHRSITKADLMENFTIFHCRMGTIQPARVSCITPVCWWHRCCWHFCSCCSRKTIPSIVSFIALPSMIGSIVTSFSLTMTQIFVFIARIDCKVKWHEYSHQNL